jgi:CubicO group peptidase (beta-lactamase class C family)
LKSGFFFSGVRAARGSTLRGARMSEAKSGTSLRRVVPHIASLMRATCCSQGQSIMPHHAIVASHRDSELPLAAFDAFVKSAMNRLQVPGAAVVLIHRARVAFSQAYGVRQVGRPERIGSRTRFMIASVTKPLTTLMMARLAEVGIIDWDEPVARKLAGFMLGDAELTSKLSFRMAVSASTGMPKREMEPVFRGRRISAEEMLARLKSTLPTTAIGAAYSYSNTLMAAGGYAAARAYSATGSLNDAYAGAMSDLVFAPLDMRHSSTLRPNASDDDIAMPHEPGFDGHTVAVPPLAQDFAFSKLPAGGIWSTAEDLARYVLLELSGGVGPDGTRLIAQDALLARRAGGAEVNADTRYGLGLYVTQRKGMTVIDHGGRTCGFTSEILFVPQSGSGLVLLTNAGAASDFRSAVCKMFFETVFAEAATADDMVDRTAEGKRQAHAVFLSRVSVDQRRTGWIGEWAGSYHNPELGSLAIGHDGERYFAASESWVLGVGARVEHEGDAIVFIDPPLAGMRLDPRTVDGEPALFFNADQTTYAFRRSSADTHRHSARGIQISLNRRATDSN